MHYIGSFIDQCFCCITNIWWFPFITHMRSQSDKSSHCSLCNVFSMKTCILHSSFHTFDWLFLECRSHLFKQKQLSSKLYIMSESSVQFTQITLLLMEYYFNNVTNCIYIQPYDRIGNAFMNGGHMLILISIWYIIIKWWISIAILDWNEHCRALYQYTGLGLMQCNECNACIQFWMQCNALDFLNECTAIDSLIVFSLLHELNALECIALHCIQISQTCIQSQPCQYTEYINEDLCYMESHWRLNVMYMVLWIRAHWLYHHLLWYKLINYEINVHNYQSRCTELFLSI